MPQELPEPCPTIAIKTEAMTESLWNDGLENTTNNNSLLAPISLDIDSLDDVKNIKYDTESNAGSEVASLDIKWEDLDLEDNDQNSEHHTSSNVLQVSVKPSIENELTFLQLKVNVEKLNLSNRVHQNAIQNLPNVKIKLKKIDVTKIDNISYCVKAPLVINNDKFNITPNGSSDRVTKFNAESVITRDNCRPQVSSPFLKLFIKLERLKLDNTRKTHTLKNPDKIMEIFAVTKPIKVAPNNRVYNYKCPQCPFKTWNLSGLQNHQTAKHGKKISQTYKCPDCQYTCTVPSQLKIHHVSHKKEADLECPECSFKSKRKCELRRHIKLRHMSLEESGAFQCTICLFKTLSQLRFKKHKASHKRVEKADLQYMKPAICPRKPELFKCNFCTYESMEKHHFEYHQQIHGGDRPVTKEIYKCEKCSYQTKLSWILRQHLLTHKNSDELPVFHCDKCSYKTTLKGTFRKHMGRAHNFSKLYRCNECSYQTHQKEVFKVHFFNVHRKTEPKFLCDKCPYKARKIRNLHIHKLTHLGPGESKVVFACDKCSYVSNVKSYFSSHLKIHKNPEDIKWHHCDQCSYKSKSPSDLRRHKNTHNTIFYECKICGTKIMNFKENFDRHMLTHLSREELRKKNKLCKCFNCGYENIKSSLTVHLRTCTKYLMYKLSL